MSPTSRKLEPKSGWKSTRSVLLCGASVRSLAESAIAAGLRPLCVDFFEDEDLKKILGSGRGRFVGRMESFEQLPQRIHSVRNTIPLLWAGGLENHSDLLREIGRQRPVIGLDPVIVDRLRDPWQMSLWLQESTICVPRLASAGRADVDCPWLRKSVTSSGGLGVGVDSSDKVVDQTLPSRGEYLQEYIDGVPMSATFCADDAGVHLFGTSLQLIGWPSLGASGFLFCGNVGPVDPGSEVTQQILDAARVIVERSGLKGVLGIDFILRQGQAWFLEVNPRITASHMLYELQHPGLVTHRHLEALGWKSARTRRSLDTIPSHPLFTQSPVAARMILWAREDIVVPKAFGADTSGAVHMADRPQPGSVVRRSSPLCSIIITAADVPEIMQHLIVQETNPRADSHRTCQILSELGYSMKSIGAQLQLLLKKFGQ